MRYNCTVFSVVCVVLLLNITISAQPVHPFPLTSGLWTQYNTGNSAIRSNSINSVFIDAEGVAWFGTDSGACGYKAGVWSSIREPLGFPMNGSDTSYAVNCISQSGDGSLWFGLRGGGVARYVKNSPIQDWTYYRHQGVDVPYSFIAGIAGELIQRKEAWVVTKVLGAARYIPDPTQPNDPTLGFWTPYNANNSSVPNTLESVAINPFNDIVCFGTHDQGVISFDMNSTWGFYPLPPEVTYPVLSMAFDVDENYHPSFAWFGKSDSGVSVFSLKQLTWVRHYTYFNTGGMMPRRQITSIATNHHNLHWFGTQAGVLQLQDSTWTMFDHSTVPELPADAITSLAYDEARGDLWIGTAQSGVIRYNPSTDGVRQTSSRAPTQIGLEQNFPNPFNPSTNFGFRIAHLGFVRLSVFDVLGSEVAILVNEIKSAGEYHAVWNASGMPGGTYFYALSAGGKREVKAMMLIK